MPVDKIINLEDLKKKYNSFYTVCVAAARPPRVCNLNEFSRATCFIFLAGLAVGSPLKNLTRIFLFKKNLFFINIMVTCNQKEKVLSSQSVLLWIFLQKWNLFWRYAESNRLWVGCFLIQLNIELQQDDRTFCCGHKIVAYVRHWIPQPTWIVAPIPKGTETDFFCGGGPFLADPDKARGCSTNTLVINSVSESVSKWAFSSHSFTAPPRPNGERKHFQL